MARLVKFVCISGDELHINADCVESVRYADGEVKLLANSRDGYYALQGTLEEVVAKLNAEPEYTIHFNNDDADAALKRLEAESQGPATTCEDLESAFKEGYVLGYWDCHQGNKDTPDRAWQEYVADKKLEANNG